MQMTTTFEIFGETLWGRCQCISVSFNWQADKKFNIEEAEPSDDEKKPFPVTVKRTGSQKKNVLDWVAGNNRKERQAK